MTSYAKGKKARAICERSGFEYPISEMVTEPGTGYRVHKSESDGKFNMVDHPQNFSFGDFSDPKSVEFARPDPMTDVEAALLAEDDFYLLLEGGGLLILE